MALVRWTLSDGGGSADFLVNPNAGGSPSYERTLTYLYTTAVYEAADGESSPVVVFEGAAKPRILDFSGLLLEQGQHDMIRTWFLTRTPVALTDDIGRSFTGYLRTFKPKRVRSRRHAWRHTYDVSFGVLSTASV